MALELNAKVLVQKCGSKNVDASVKVGAQSIDAYRAQELLWSDKNTKAILSEKKAKLLVARLINSLTTAPTPKAIQVMPAAVAKRVLVEPVKIEPANEAAIEAPGMLLDEVFSEEGADMYRAEQPMNAWQLETGASVDHWNSGIGTKPYPGFRIRSGFKMLKLWAVEGSFAFGASAFQVDERVIWNQQLLGAFSIARNFELSSNLRLGPSAGYFYWVSMSESASIPRFNHHDLLLGGAMTYEMRAPHLEWFTTLHFLPVNLGVSGQLGLRYHFAPNWYASIGGQVVGLWAKTVEGSFLTASVGLGCSL